MQARIKAAIQAAGIPCYDPGTQVGKIAAPYVVAHDLGTTPKEGTKGMLGTHQWEIVALVPYKAQDKLPSLVAQVKAALATLSPLRWTGEAGPTGLESTYEGAAISLIYSYPTRLI